MKAPEARKNCKQNMETLIASKNNKENVDADIARIATKRIWRHLKQGKTANRMWRHL